jgi:hypothetical protein
MYRWSNVGIYNGNIYNYERDEMNEAETECDESEKVGPNEMG